jgi:hypothetical protein
MNGIVRQGILASFALALASCGDPPPAEAPPGGWANLAPTVVEQVVERGAHQLLQVRQGELRTWVQVPRVGARAGDHVLLGRGTARTDVPIPEVSQRAPEVVDIAHVRVVDAETARRAVARRAPPGALSVGQAHAELERRAGTEIVVFGRVVKATSAVGSVWVHLQDGTGDPRAKTHDLTVQTRRGVVPGQWVAFRGTLRRDVDLGFGYHYKALVERGTLVE